MSTNSSDDTQSSALISAFFVHDALFGLDTSRVQEVIRPGVITKVHHASEEVLGIINLRGRIVTIIDLGLKLSLGKLTLTGESRVYIVEDQNEFVGLLVDRVSDAIEVPRASLLPPPPNVKGVQGKFFEGVHQNGGNLIAVLKTSEILSLKNRHPLV